jgi:membrane-associated phospholipid phosphatase
VADPNPTPVRAAPTVRRSLRRGPPRRASGALLVTCAAAVGYAALTALVVARGRVPLDGLLLSWTSQLQERALRAPMYWVSDLGDLAIGAVLALCAVALAIGPSARRRRAVFVGSAVGGAMAVKWLTSVLVARPATGLSGSYDDFPSGHAAGTMAIAGATTVLLWGTRRRWLAVLALVFAVAVGVSRVYLRKHFPSDVAAGWLLAALMVAGAAAVQLLAARPIDGPLDRRAGRGLAKPRALHAGARPTPAADRGCEP